ncbi:alpha/beta hydrolase [Arthrobacter sp. GCM10027362]|uniref:alpha/beta hydrolase n=1 Tax=Arthrobacter sp. GCM10027362 TaxID=3273379 RepID=UPI00363B1389
MPGTQPLGLVNIRDPLLYIPPSPGPGHSPGLVVALHGAGGEAAGGLALLLPWADRFNLALLAPASRRTTWDAIGGGYGPDVDLIDAALERVFALVALAPERIGIAGFSDGASYALGLGLANGGLFRRIIAFSPGFIPSAGRVGKPKIFVSHGSQDAVLPVAATSRRIVPILRRDGYDVTYREFDGPHAVPREISGEAAAWLGWDAPG